VGVTIHYLLGARDPEALTRTLEEAKVLAMAMGMRIVVDDTVHHRLFIQPSEECETLVFEFRPWGEIRKTEDWDYAKAMISDHFNLEPPSWMSPETKEEVMRWEDKTLWCGEFCKTQFAGDQTHVRVAELIRYVASRCSYVYINDEGDYYESRDSRKALDAINKTAELIGKVCEELQDLGFKVVRGFDLARK